MILQVEYNKVTCDVERLKRTGHHGSYLRAVGASSDTERYSHWRPLLTERHPVLLQHSLDGVLSRF